MVQEAKLSCYKKWYLPAGRMEPNETIVEAVKREVLEEAGLEFQPTSLLCVEECGGRWVRFSLVGKVSGGKLKTTEEADEESLQAMWWDREEQIQIRCKDVLPLIKLGVERYEMDMNKVTVLLPSLQSHKLLFIRALCIYKNCDDDPEFSILLRKNFIENSTNNSTDAKVQYSVPTSRVHPEDISFHRAVHAICGDVLKLTHSEYGISICGIAGVEHMGDSSSGHDGLGVSLIVNLQTNGAYTEPPSCKTGYIWVGVNEIKDEVTLSLLKDKLKPTNSIPLRSLKANL